jgi:hypothetical protein
MIRPSDLPSVMTDRRSNGPHPTLRADAKENLLMIRLNAWTSMLALWLLALAPVSTKAAQQVASPPVSTSAKTDQPSRNMDFEAGWINYFSPDTCVYLAVPAPRIDGPLMRHVLDPEYLAKAREKVSGKAMTDLEKIVTEYTDAAKKEKIIEKDMIELFALGFAQGLRPGPKKDEPGFLVVVTKTDKLRRFYEWAVTRYRAEKGPDSLKDVAVEGIGGVTFAKLGKNQPVVVQTDKHFLISNRQEEIAQALKLAKLGKDHLGTTKAYKRARIRVNPKAAGFVLVNPIPTLDVLKGNYPLDAEQQTKLSEVRNALESLDAVVLQGSGESKIAQLDLLFILGPGSSAATRLAKSFQPKSLKSIDAVPADIHAFLGLIRPQDPTATLAGEMKEKVTQQLQTVKGTLQMQTGLDYDKDVAPWWGQEFGVAVSMSTGVPEVALLFESLDSKASQDAINKVVRHLSVTQNREFDEKKIGNATIRVVKQGAEPQKSPLNPALCSVNNLVVLASGPGVVEAIVQSEKKLGNHPGYALVKNLIPVDRTMVTFFLRSDLIAKVRNMASGGAASPATEATQQLTDQVDSFLVSVGSPDAETILFTALIVGK